MSDKKIIETYVSRGYKHEGETVFEKISRYWTEGSKCFVSSRGQLFSKPKVENADGSISRIFRAPKRK